MKNIGNKRPVFLIFPINGNIPALHLGACLIVGKMTKFN
jgi:hypothetical protein